MRRVQLFRAISLIRSPDEIFCSVCHPTIAGSPKFAGCCGVRTGAGVSVILVVAIVSTRISAETDRGTRSFAVVGIVVTTEISPNLNSAAKGRSRTAIHSSISIPSSAVIWEAYSPNWWISQIRCFDPN